MKCKKLYIWITLRNLLKALHNIELSNSWILSWYWNFSSESVSPRMSWKINFWELYSFHAQFKLVFNWQHLLKFESKTHKIFVTTNRKYIGQFPKPSLVRESDVKSKIVADGAFGCLKYKIKIRIKYFHSERAKPPRLLHFKSNLCEDLF